MPDATARSGSTASAPLTVGITTRNRPDALRRCLESLHLLGGLLREVIVIDDTSDVPVADALASFTRPFSAPIRVVRQPAAEGYIVGRNSIMRLAASDYVLLMDDDAYLVNEAGVKDAVDVLDRHADVAAVGCAQAESDGRPWPAAMQAAPVSYRCRVPSFIGFAHLLRVRAFHEAGGYPEALHFYGEEKVLCARFLRAGYKVIYMPDVLVAHVPDPSGRNADRYVRYVIRNDCLFAFYNLPWPAVFVYVPVHLLRFFRMKRNRGFDDLTGFCWVVWHVMASLPDVLRARAPLSWANLAEWRALRRHSPAFPA
jgi:GT2 family glycosyltransferase